MKINTLKIALTCCIASVFSVNASPNRSLHFKNHLHDHSDSTCFIPIPDTTVDDLSLMFAANFHSITRDLNVIFAAEAFALHPISIIVDSSTSPSTLRIVNPHIAELLEAANGQSYGSIGQSLINLSNIFNAFEIDSDLILSALKKMTLAAEQYSIAVANNIPSTPYFDVWINAGNAFGDALALALNLKPHSKKIHALRNEINEIIVNQANAVQGFNEVLELSALSPCKTQSAAALKFDQFVRRATIKLYRMIALEITKVANKNNNCQFSHLYNLYDKHISFFHQINRDLEAIFAAEAFAPHPIPASINSNNSPPTIKIKSPHIAELVKALNRNCIGSIKYSLAKISKIFHKFGISINSSNIRVGFAAEQYSISIANQIPSISYLNSWLNASIVFGNELGYAFDLKPDSKNLLTIQSELLSLVVNQAQSIQALNGILPSSDLLPGETQSAAALRFLQQARLSIINFDYTISKLLIKNER